MWRGRRVGEVTLRRVAPASAIVAPRYVAMGGALFFAAIALALFLGRWLAGRISEPVARLSSAMEEVGRNGDFARRVEPSAADELGHLTESFNGLLATLNQNDQALRRTVGELMTARDAAEAANVQKSQFLANMSHEIRTPLNGVLAMAQILARSGLGSAQGEQVEVIRTSGEALLEILNDILDVSKIEAGKFELDVAEFDLEEVVNGVHASLAGIAERKSLTFTVDVAPDARGVRLGDAIRLRQILNNLVSNALKFTDEGHVSLTVRGEGPAGEAGLHVAVADTGVGIDPAKHSLLFQKFSQIDASATRRFSGTGLGLAICHDLAELMGGRVWVESTPGQGSTFYAVLQARRVRAAPVGQTTSLTAQSSPSLASAAAADLPNGAGLRILAAEDNPVNQLVLSTVMQIFGVELAIVANGREAVETWRREAFDLILMDIQMPVMDGMSATAAIRAAEAETGRKRTPIVALSANALPHQVADYLAVGMDTHVAKPIEIAKLQTALDVLLTPEGDIAA